MKRLIKIFPSFLMIASGTTSLAFGDPLPDANACYYESLGFCTESDSIDVATDCAGERGEVRAACPEENRIGSCKITRNGKVLMTRYYDGTQVNPVKMCKASSGIYTPGFSEW